MQKQLQNRELKYLSLDDAENYFYSHDIGLVAFLLCRHYEMAGLDKALKSKVLFILKRKSNLNRAVKDYWDCKTSVDAQTYFNQLKRLKNQIFSSD